jgi:hypothetical protein
MPLLHWLTRDEDLRPADRVPYRLLNEVPDLSAGEGDEGLLVQGNNLEALKALLHFYAGRVKCIYIDPPYNTPVGPRVLRRQRRGYPSRMTIGNMHIIISFAGHNSAAKPVSAGAFFP